jgi:multidrug efflux pump subunit AcrA (membrane-fusion protein)
MYHTVSFSLANLDRRRSMIRIVLVACSSLLIVPLASMAGEKPLELYARVTGHVAKVHVKKGDAVKKGELLFELDDRELLAARELAAANVQRAEAELQLTRANVERAARLLQNQAIGNAEYEAAVLDHAKAQAKQRAAGIELTSAKLVLEHAKIAAPMDARVSELDGVIGSLVKANETRLAILQPAKSDVKEGKQPSTKLKELMKERHAALLKVLELRTDLVEQGRGGPEAMVQAQGDVMKSGLELAETQAERLALLRKGVETAELLHKFAETRFKAGAGPEIELLQARALVLEAQIRLLREEEKGK